MFAEFDLVPLLLWESTKIIRREKNSHWWINEKERTKEKNEQKENQKKTIDSDMHFFIFIYIYIQNVM